MQKFLRSVLLGATMLPLLFGQGDAGRIVGTVTDSTGAVLPGATIIVTNEKTSQERKAVADSAGYFALPNLPPSTYSVKAEAKGLGQGNYSGIPLSVGQERVVNVILQPETVTTEVNVSGGELTTIDFSSAAIGANVNSRE